MEHIKASSVSEAWRAAARIFPTDYEKNEENSKRAGYPIYETTSTDERFSGFHISDLNTRLQLAGKLRTGTQQIAGRYFAGTRRNDHPPAPDSSSAGGSGSCHSDTGPPCSRLLHCRYQAAGNLPERGRPQQQGQRFHPSGSAEYAPLL